mmetsp:Transcript_83329/g.258773  ORF Transcript_83329/g.258773 Transcript_83329/m.258773 type:complete len:444 (+) Transcript_83329:109-1440(+)
MELAGKGEPAAGPGAPQEHTDDVAATVTRSSGFLRDWPRGVRVAVLAQYLNQTMTAIVLGALFDAYLLVLRGSNTFVGSLESARGLASLALALPLGWAADRWPKPLVLRCNAAVGAAASLLLLAGIPSDSVPLIFAGAVASSLHNQCLFGLFPALLSEMTEAGDQRMKALSHMQTAASAGLASGPALQLVLMLATNTTRWTTSELHWVLCSGLLLFVPFVVLVWRIRHSDLSVGPAAVAAATSNGGGGQTPLLRAAAPRQRWLVAVLVEFSSLVTAIGSGMTFKYWPLFFVRDFGFSPSGVAALQLAIWAAIAASAQIAPKMARKVGRAPTILLLHVIGTAMLFCISLSTMPALFTAPLVLLRNAVMNGATPLIQSIVMDTVPQRHRGKWSSIASLRRVTWSGSAFVGGLLSDSHDYRFAFFATACVHSAAGVVLLAVVALRP